MPPGIRSIRFSTYSAEEVAACSVVQVQSPSDLHSPLFGAQGTQLCGTCHQAAGVCEGHFGHIELPFELPHPLHRRTVQQILNGSCCVCGRRSKTRRCSDCRDKPPCAPDVHRCRAEEWPELLRGTPVANLMLRNLPVPPLSIRPDNDQYNHPITTLLSGILRTLARHKRIVATGGTPEALESCRGMLAKRVHDYFLCDTNSRTPGLCTRLLGKQGRMRNNLMGFRVNSAARAVITPDPYCPPWELRVPARVWDRLGLRDGETVLFNRQPSLHCGSIMAHVARRSPNNSFSFSPTVTEPYNADYDGDEMNMHKLSSVDAQVEARMLMGVEYNMVSPANGKTWVHLVQDCVLSEHLQGKDPRRTADARELHRRQVDAIDHLLARGFSIGLDDFLHKIQPVGDHDIDCVSRTADIVCDQLPPGNSLLQMVRARSKGSPVNLVQLMSCVGWQTVQGRPSEGPPGTSSFVRHSYVEGLDPGEFWHHACAGREGLIQTAIKTSKTGYLQRKLIKFMEDVRSCYDGTVRNQCTGQVVQFSDAYEPGAPVGVTCAQSIGQPITQSTLNTFHMAGIAQDTGLKKMQSLLDVASGPSCIVRGLPDAHLLLRWHSAAAGAAGPPSAKERMECHLRGTEPPLRRWVHACPHGMRSWQAAALARSKGHYAHASGSQVIAGTEALAIEGHAGSPEGVCFDRGDLEPSTEAYCTDLKYMRETYGIEAARAVLLKELESFGSIDKRHYELLADAMTTTGQVLSVNRTGVAKFSKPAVLGRACFETVLQTLLQAGRMTQSDTMAAASSRLAMGMAPVAGTNAFSIVSTAPSQQKRRSEVANFLDAPVQKKHKFTLAPARWPAAR